MSNSSITNQRTKVQLRAEVMAARLFFFPIIMESCWRKEQYDKWWHNIMPSFEESQLRGWAQLQTE